MSLKNWKIIVVIAIVTIIIATLLLHEYTFKAPVEKAYAEIVFEGVVVPKISEEELESVKERIITEVVNEKQIELSTTVEPHEGGTLLRVSAYGISKISPDTVVVTITIEATGKTAEEAINNASSLISQVDSILEELKIPKEKVKTSSYYLGPIYVYEKDKPPKIVGYKVTYVMTITLNDIKLSARLIDKVSKVKIMRISIRLALSNEAYLKAYLQALKNAILQALEKVKVIASTLNMTISRVVSITEGSIYISTPRYTGVLTAEKARTELYAGTITVRATISLVVELKSSD